MTLFHLDYHDDQQRRGLRFLELAFSDLRAFWPMVTRLAIGWIGRQFDEEGDFFGSHWSALSPDYAAWKDDHYPGKLILSREGALRRAATSPTREVGPMSLVLTIEPYDTGTGTVDPGWFQEGTSRMPARPLVPSTDQPLPAEAQAELDAAAAVYVREMVGRSGLLA